MKEAEVQRAAIGRVRKPHGIRGGLKVTLYSIDLEQLRALEQLFVKSGTEWQSMTLAQCQGSDDDPILVFKECVDRTQAETLRNQEIFTLRDALPELDPNEFYIQDLMGCTVSDDDGAHLGTVVDILTPGAHEVLVVQGDAEHLIPFVGAWVNHVDLDAREITVFRSEEEL